MDVTNRPGAGTNRRQTGMANLKSLVSQYERQLIESALEAAAGNQRRAAYALGVLPT
jgi:transcriptional regulator with PAS, ATPase and Fis domain